MSQESGPTNVRRCHATILFADLCASTELAENCDPESLAEILHQVRATAERVVAKYNGVINQFYGDGVLAAFGFPFPYESDVLHATQAALALNEAVAGLSLGQYLPGSFKLRLHTGVHAGLIVVQEGDRLQGQYKLYGDALNTAARLADAAGENEVYASESTLRGVLPYFEVEKLEPLSLKGKGAALAAYRVLGSSGVRTRYEASIRRGLAPFVGRGDKLGELSEHWREARGGRMRVVKVIGDAGLGKTRLIEEFLPSLENEATIFRAYCEQGGGAIPLQPFIQVLRQCFHLERDTSLDAAAVAIGDRLRELGGALSGLENTFITILSMSQDAVAEPLQPEEISRAIVTLIAALARREPLVLFIDDWHWVDDMSHRIFGGLVSSLSELPVMVLLASRSDDLSDRALSYARLRLSPFDAGESGMAVASLFSGGVDMWIVDAIFERSGGNALFIEELCQSLRAGGYEEVTEVGAWKDVPSTLHGLIESRVDRLQPHEQELIRTAAVIGRVIPGWLLERVLGYRLAEDLVLELSHQDLLYPADGKGQLRFKHGLTRDVVYQSVTLRERQEIHRQVAEILRKTVSSGGGDKYFEALAYHYNSAGEYAQALHYAELAGDKALASRALDRARVQYGIALDAIDQLQDGEDRYRQRNRIVEQLGWACVFDPFPEQIELLQRELALVQERNDLKSEARIEYWLGYINYALGRSTAATDHCVKSLEEARRLGEKGLEYHVLATLGQARATRSDYGLALQCFDEAAHMRKRHKPSGNSLNVAYSLACQAMVYADFGEFDRAQQQFEEVCHSMVGTAAEMEGSVWALRAAAWLWQGCWHKAIEATETAAERARRIPNAYVLGMGTAMGAYARWRLDGDFSHVDDMIEAANWLESKGKLLFNSINFGYLAKALAAKGDVERVRYYAARALSRAHQGDRLGEAFAYRTLAKISQQNPTMKPWRFYLDRALASAQARDSRHERATTTLARGELLLAEEPARARQLLERARDEFAAMGMEWHRECAEGLLATD